MTPQERSRYGAMTLEELRVEWVVLMALGRRLASEIEAEGTAGTTGVRPTVAAGLISRYRDLESRWDYVDDLLLERTPSPSDEAAA